MWTLDYRCNDVYISRVARPSVVLKYLSVTLTTDNNSSDVHIKAAHSLPENYSLRNLIDTSSVKNKWGGGSG